MPRVPPPILMLALALAMWPLGVGGVSSGRTVAAIAVFFLAAAFGFPAIRAFRRVETTVDPVRVDRASALITGGI